MLYYPGIPASSPAHPDHRVSGLKQPHRFCHSHATNWYGVKSLRKFNLHAENLNESSRKHVLRRWYGNWLVSEIARISRMFGDQQQVRTNSPLCGFASRSYRPRASQYPDQRRCTSCKAREGISSYSPGKPRWPAPLMPIGWDLIFTKSGDDRRHILHRFLFDLLTIPAL